MANWSEKDLRKSKKVIFQSKPSPPAMMSLLVYFSIKSRFLHILCAVFVKKVRSAILKLKKNGFPENNHFSRFSPQNPIIHYSKNPKNVSNWSQNWIRKSKKVIFWSEPSGPPMHRLLVYFLMKSRFLHVSWPVSVKKVPATIQNPKKINFSHFQRRPLFPASTDPKYPQNFPRALRAETEKKSSFSIFTLKSYNTLH